MERKQKKKLVLFLVALAITVGFTAVVKFVGVEAVGPEGSSVGLATINAALHNATGFNEFFYKLTKYLGLALALPVGMFVCLGAKQLLKRKSLKKVDREYKLLAGFFALVAVVYVIFEKLLVINYRPELIDGALEASYPSSHTLFAVTICGSASILSRYLIDKKYVGVFNALLVVLMLIIVVGRTLSGVHWLTDIIGGILFGATLISGLAMCLGPRETKSETVSD